DRVRGIDALCRISDSESLGLAVLLVRQSTECISDGSSLARLPRGVCHVEPNPLRWFVLWKEPSETSTVGTTNPGGGRIRSRHESDRPGRDRGVRRRMYGARGPARVELEGAEGLLSRWERPPGVGGDDLDRGDRDQHRDVPERAGSRLSGRPDLPTAPDRL